jgi:hypothetical protein
MRRRHKTDDDEPTPHEKVLIEEAESAERYADDTSGGRSVPIRAQGARDVFSLKVGAEELDEIADAAEASGLSVGAFIRQAALEKARRHEGVVLKRVREQVRELAETVGRL